MLVTMSPMSPVSVMVARVEVELSGEAGAGARLSRRLMTRCCSLMV